MAGPRITTRRRKVRSFRGGGKQYYKNEEGKKSSHVMEWGEDSKNGKKRYTVNPTVFPKKGKEGSHKKEDWKVLTGKREAYDEAKKRGEVVSFRRKKRAEKFAAGSWKKGKDRKEAMKKYRINRTR